MCIGPNFILIHVSGTEKDKYHVFLTILVNEEYPIIEPIDIVDPQLIATCYMWLWLFHNQLGSECQEHSGNSHIHKPCVVS